MNNIKYIVIFFIIFGCTNDNNNWKKYDLKSFSIQLPENWIYNEEQGIDSFIGKFKNGQAELSFDYCDFGCANELIPTLQEYFNEYDYVWIPGCPFCESGITYTAAHNVEVVKKILMKELNTNNPDSVDVRPDPEYTETYRKSNKNDKTLYPESDYICILKHHGDSIIIPIEIPERINKHNIKVTRTDTYVIKTITPKVIGEGMTGIYYKSINGRGNFNLYGYNFNKADNETVLEIFKHIEMK